MAGGADPGFGNIPRDLEHEKFILEFACTPPGFQTAEGLEREGLMRGAAEGAGFILDGSQLVMAQRV